MMTDKGWEEFVDDVVPKNILTGEEFATARDVFNQRGKIETLKYLK